MESHKSKIDLLIIGIIVLVLVLGVGLVLRPGDFFKESRNITRQSHMQLLMTAVYAYATDHNGVFPDCLPETNQPAVNINNCYDELTPYLMHLVIVEPDHPKHSYMIEYVHEGTEKAVRIFSTAPEAEKLENIR